MLERAEQREVLVGDLGAGEVELAHVLQLVARVHDDGSVPGDRLLERAARDEQEADALLPGLHDHLVTAPEQALAQMGSEETGSPDAYDLLIFVANWPAKRRVHWRQLLIARAIENQACVIGVNRIGSDANGLEYSGDSLAVAADGVLLEDMADRADVALVTLDGAALRAYRESFPCHLDADEFSLN